MNDPQELLRQGEEIIKDAPKGKYHLRVSCVNILLTGSLGTKELSRCCGVPVRTLQNWVKDADEKGWESLKDAPRPGRKPRLSAADKEAIKQLVIDDKPELYGYYVWDTRTLAEYIRNTYDIQYGQRATNKLMKDLGLTLVRPTTQPSLENPTTEAEEEFKEKLKAALADPSMRVCHQDEVHFQMQPNVTRKWTEKGTKLKVMSKPGKQSIAYSGFVFPDDGTLFVTKPGWFTYETVIQCFRDLIEAIPLPEGVRFCVILDNAPWHQKAIRLIWGDKLDEYQDIRDKMCYLRLPPYCPHLNPIEQVWRITRREVTHNRYFPSLDKLIGKLDAYYAKYSRPNEKFRSLCDFNFSIVDENGNKVKPKRAPRGAICEGGENAATVVLSSTPGTQSVPRSGSVEAIAG